MAYTPTIWNCGDTITADALNHIEQGIAGSGGGTDLVRVKISRDENDNFVADMPCQDIYDAVLADKIVVLTDTDTHKNYFYAYAEEEEAEITALVFCSTPTINEVRGVYGDALVISLEDCSIYDGDNRWDCYSCQGSPTILYLVQDVETGGFDINGISENDEWDGNPTLYQVIDVFDSDAVSHIMVGGYNGGSLWRDLNYAFVPIAYDDNTNSIYFMVMYNNNGTVTTSYESIDLSDLPT